MHISQLFALRAPGEPDFKLGLQMLPCVTVTWSQKCGVDSSIVRGLGRMSESDVWLLLASCKFVAWSVRAWTACC